jgi:hypothetical protein
LKAMRKSIMFNYLTIAFLIFIMSSCSLSEGVEGPGYVATGLTVVFLIFVIVWFLRRLKR